MVTKMNNALDGETKFVKMVIKNGTPVICGRGFKLELLDPVCHKSGAVVYRIPDAMSSMDDWNVKSSLLDSESSVSGVEDELSGLVLV